MINDPTQKHPQQWHSSFTLPPEGEISHRAGRQTQTDSFEQKYTFYGISHPTFQSTPSETLAQIRFM